MDRLREFLDILSEKGQAEGNFLGLLHVLIGRRITLDDGTLVSSGQSWRDLAARRCHVVTGRRIVSVLI